jgi:hypothetical protein
MGGVALYLLGAICTVAAWSRTEQTYLGTKDHGNIWVASLGGIAAFAGSMLMLVAVIGHGVKLGREAANLG